MMATYRPAISLAILIALLLACGLGRLAAQEETGTLRLRLDASLANESTSTPLWAALFPDGESVPELKDLEQLPPQSGRFVDGLLEFNLVEHGSYQLRIYRAPTWFAARYPQVQRGRVEEIEDSVPWLIEVAGPLEEVEVTRTTIITSASDAQSPVSLFGRVLLPPNIPTEKLKLIVTTYHRRDFPGGKELACVPIDERGLFLAAVPMQRAVNLAIRTPGGLLVFARRVMLHPTGMTRLGDIDLRDRIRRLTVRVQEPNGRPIHNVTLRFWERFLSWTTFEAPDGVFDLVCALDDRKDPFRHYDFDAFGFRQESIHNFQGDTIVTLDPVPAVRLESWRPGPFGTPRFDRRHCAVLTPAESSPKRIQGRWDLTGVPHGRFSDGIAEIEVESEGRYHLEIYRLDTFLGKDAGATKISDAKPVEIEVRGRLTEIGVGTEPPTIESLTVGVRLRLAPALALPARGNPAPLWGALYPEGVPIPTVEYVEDLPKLAGRFIGGVLHLPATAPGRYEVRIYRVRHSWFTKQCPDRRLGRAEEVQGTQPRTIEVKGRLTEVEVTVPEEK